MPPHNPHLVVPTSGNEIVHGCCGHDVIVVAVHHKIMFENGIIGQADIVFIVDNHQVFPQVLSVFLSH